MTKYSQPSSCLSPETLALMASGKLPALERTGAEAHLASCEDCYEVLMELTESAPASQAAPPIIVWSRAGRRRPIIVWSAVAAVVVAAVFLSSRFLRGPDSELDSAVGTLARAVGESRPSVGRLNGGFEWGSAPAITRGAGTTELPLAVQDAVLSVKKLAAGRKTARSMDALGVAHLVSGDLDASLAALDEAVALDPKDAGARADLAAARLEKWRRTQAPVDATAALDAAQHALLIAPKDAVARFNHAMSVEALGLKEAAIDSWKAYLAIDSKSKWAEEARAHLASLGSGTAGGLPADTGRDRYLPDLTAAIASEKDPQRLDCLTRGRQAITDSRIAFDESRTVESERLAQVAKAAFVCGRVPTFEADAQIVWTHYFLGRAVESPALAALAADARRAGYLRAAGRVQYARGRLAGNAARYSDAEALFAEALNTFQQAGDAELMASASVQMSEIAKGFGDQAGTWQRLAAAMGSMPLLAPRRQHMTLEAAYLSAERFGQSGASRFFAEALVDADERNATDPAILAGAYLESARAAFRLGDIDDALRRLTLAKATTAKIGDSAFRTQYTAEINETEGTIIAGRDPRASIAALSSAMDTFERAGRPLRRARLLLIRGRSYRTAGDAAAAERDWAEGAGIFEDQRPEIRDAQQQIDHFDQLWDLFRELMTVRSSHPEASLEVAERFRGRALLDALSRDARSFPLSGAAMYSWLPRDVTAIAYAVLPDRLLRWTISRDGVTVDTLKVGSVELNALVDRYRASLSSDSAENRADATRLSDLLLPSTLSRLGATRIVFLPDGALFGVPFSALPLPGDSSRLVVDQFIPSIAPSLTVLKNTAQPLAPSSALLVAAGDANPGESLPALPGAGAEVKALAAIHRRTVRLEGAAATPAAVLSAIPSAGIVHFAGHAIADSARPSRSRLLVAGPSVISFDDLRRVRLRSGAVVVLSACDAARGPVFHGEGPVGLSYPFLANGASAVIASIWQIDDATPVSLWQSFHARVSAGAAPDAALAESQRIIRRQGVAPSLWAAFVSVGGLAVQ